MALIRQIMTGGFICSVAITPNWKLLFFKVCYEPAVQSWRVGTRRISYVSELGRTSGAEKNYLIDRIDARWNSF
jgi:hypothetical protein